MANPKNPKDNPATAPTVALEPFLLENPQPHTVEGYLRAARRYDKRTSGDWHDLIASEFAPRTQPEETAAPSEGEGDGGNA